MFFHSDIGGYTADSASRDHFGPPSTMLQTTCQSPLLPVLCPWPRATLSTIYVLPTKPTRTSLLHKRNYFVGTSWLGHRDMLATQHLLMCGHLGNAPLQVACGQVHSSKMCFLPVWKTKTQMCYSKIHNTSTFSSSPHIENKRPPPWTACLCRSLCLFLPRLFIHWIWEEQTT